MGFATILDAFRLRWAAKAYARWLGPRLLHDYGASDYYTEAQIRSAGKKLKLPQQYIKVGFSAFMPESDFVKLVGEASDYKLLRSLYSRFVPPHLPFGEMGEAGAYSQSETMAGTGASTLS